MMMIGKLTGIRLVVVGVLACAVLGVAGVAPAFAAGGTPWWNVTGTAAPGDLPPGGYAQIVVRASNLGDGEAMGSLTPIALTDRLPAGVIPIGISGAAGPLGSVGSGECSLEAVSCKFQEGIPPYLAVEMDLTVRVEPSAVSGGVEEAVVEGGGAPRATFRHPLTVSGGPTPFGVEAYEQVPESVGGVPDTQAGAHPFSV